MQHHFLWRARATTKFPFWIKKVSLSSFLCSWVSLRFPSCFPSVHWPSQISSLVLLGTGSAGSGRAGETPPGLCILWFWRVQPSTVLLNAFPTTRESSGWCKHTQPDTVIQLLWVILRIECKSFLCKSLNFTLDWLLTYCSSLCS